MYLVLVTLLNTDEAHAEKLRPSIVIDLLWALVGPRDHLEHVSASVGSNRIDFGLFYSARTDVDARRAAEELFWRAADTSSYLRRSTFSVANPISSLALRRNAFASHADF